MAYQRMFLVRSGSLLKSMKLAHQRFCKRMVNVAVWILVMLVNATQAAAPLEGIRYWKTTTPLKQSAYILEIDPAKLEIIPAHAKEKVLGRETVAVIAKRHHAIAAINGGFFKIGHTTNGLPAGILKIENQWYGIAYQPRAAIGWSSKIQKVLMDRVQTKTLVYLNHRQFPVHAVNQPGFNHKAVLYTDAYGPQAGSVAGGYDIVIQDNRIVGFESSGKTAIPKGGYVYAIGTTAKYLHHSIDIGQSATVNIEIIPQLSKEYYLAWQMVDHVIGGSPLLVYHGKRMQDYAVEGLRPPFVHERYARTAVGVLKNGHWLLVVVEQSAFNGSPGMSIPELADFMHQLGCEYALNLDGGSSSTLYINNKVINHPEDDADQDEDYRWSAFRPVSDAILILPKSKKSRASLNE